MPHRVHALTSAINAKFQRKRPSSKSVPEISQRHHAFETQIHRPACLSRSQAADHFSSTSPVEPQSALPLAPDNLRVGQDLRQIPVLGSCKSDHRDYEA